MAPRAPHASSSAPGRPSHAPARSTTSAAFFEQKYASAPDRDPWRFATDAFEQRRYHQLLATLPRERYRCAFEPGCSVGALTALLAPRCDRLLAVDLSATAVRAAVDRICAQGEERECTAPAVELRVASVTDALRPDDGPFDLILLSEIGYYFDVDELGELVRSLVEHLAPAGDLVASHWTGSSEDHVLGGERTHDVIDAVLGWPRLGPRLHTGGAGPASPQAPVLPEGVSGAVVDRWRRP